MSTKDTDSILSVFLTNLGKYNEGELIGEWVALPIDEDELATIRERIGINEEYEEEFLTDWESPIKALYEYVGEYTSIESLNELAAQLEDIPEDDYPILNAIYDITGDFDNMLSKYSVGDYRVYGGCYSMEAVACTYLEETGAFHGLPSFIETYFDYESFGRDMSLEGSYTELDDGTIVEVYY